MRGKAKYRLDDTKVRVFVAPSVAELESSPVRPHFCVPSRGFSDD